jgi:hypothetical protein
MKNLPGKSEGPVHHIRNFNSEDATGSDIAAESRQGDRQREKKKERRERERETETHTKEIERDRD